MDNPIQTLSPQEFPTLLSEIDDPPERLYLQGNVPPEEHWKLCVVGSRKASGYGKRAVEHIVSGLAGLPITIVSGLALGIDSEAHRAALNAGLNTLAVPGSGLDPSVLYPKSHHGLARDILAASGGSTGSPQGGLVTEFEPTFQATRWSFPQRNRIMAGLSHAVLIVEASEQSGTLITARLATDYNREVMAVPGSIFSDGSAGPHQLIRDGATPITCADDVCDSLGIERADERSMNVHDSDNLEDLSENERALVTVLAEPHTRDELIAASGLSASEANTALSMLEIKGKVKEEMGKVYRC
jgi:DNA processing protein